MRKINNTLMSISRIANINFNFNRLSRDIPRTIKSRSKQQGSLEHRSAMNFDWPKHTFSICSDQFVYIRAIPTLLEISTGGWIDESSIENNINFGVYGFVNPPYELKFRRQTYKNGLEDDEYYEHGFDVD